MKDRIFNRTTLKYIAVAAMLIDHIAMFFLPAGTIIYAVCRTIGRFCAPTMCFFLVEGFIHTSSRVKYGKRLLLFGLISQFPYSLALHHSLLTADFNMIIMLFLSFLMLCAYPKMRPGLLRVAVIAAIIIASLWCDWGFFGPITVLIFYLNYADKRAKTIGYIITVLCMNTLLIGYHLDTGSNWYAELWQLGMLLFVPVIFLYNGSVGSVRPIHKWFFYVFYPAHLLIIWLLLLI